LLKLIRLPVYQLLLLPCKPLIQLQDYRLLHQPQLLKLSIQLLAYRILNRRLSILQLDFQLPKNLLHQPNLSIPLLDFLILLLQQLQFPVLWILLPVIQSQLLLHQFQLLLIQPPDYQLLHPLHLLHRFQVLLTQPQDYQLLLRLQLLFQLHLKLLIQQPDIQFKLLLHLLYLLHRFQVLLIQPPDYQLLHLLHLLHQFQVPLIQPQDYQLLLRRQLLSTRQLAYR